YPVLAIYAHPDDEGQVSGTLAAFVGAGHPVTLVCATRGEVGEISDPVLATSETLGYVRELELRSAMAQVGVHQVEFLSYRDSGMAGTPENDDSRCLHQAPAELVTEDLVTIIRRTKPGLVFTWDPTGGYGHPDHLAVHRHTVSAYDAAGDPAAFPDAGAPHQASALYWGTLRMKQFATLRLELEARGLLPDPLDDEMRERLAAAMNDPDPTISVVHDVRAHLESKQRASSMHRSQFGEGSVFSKMPDDLREQFFAEERFYRARPAWNDDDQPLVSFH
ncbi:MAG TPA: PIG-L family deacetylase, partial [Dehalococcoidia bacterium]|nr:PIG-L family deacetylase [Dehalococcoidia bacterium]